MRVSSVGWLYDDIDEARRIARLATEVTHNTEAAMKGTECIAGCVLLARKGYSKWRIRKFAESFGYDLNISVNGIRETGFDVSCEGSCFLESKDMEDAIRNGG